MAELIQDLIEAARSAGCRESDGWIFETAVQLATEVWKARAKGQDPVFYDAHTIKATLDTKLADMVAERERQRQGGTVH